MHMFLNDRYEESKNDEIPDCCLLSVEHTYQRWFGSFDQKNFYPTTITTNSLAKSTPEYRHPDSVTGFFSSM